MNHRHPLTQIDAEGRKYAWTYDGLGRASSETDFTGFTTTYVLDQAGNPYQKSNRLTEITRTTFDALNRPTNVSYVKDGTSEALTYDPEGNLNYVANNTIGYSMVYDNLNRLTGKTDSRAHSLGFTWDKSGHLLTKTTYQGSTTRYTYDGAGTLVSITNPNYLTINYQYDNAGRLLSRVMSSGARSLYTYDNGGWLQTLNHFDAIGTNVTSQSYTRDRVGNITGLNVTTGPNPGSTAYTLDALYRLTVVNAPATANDEAFGYDHIGNRLIATRGSTTVGASGTGITSKYSVYNPATQTGTVAGYTPTYNNRLKEIHLGSITGTLDASFTFDNEGRMTAQSGTMPRTLTWDAKGRLATLNSGSTETYLYDPSNHRIGRVGGALGSTNYFLEGEHLESVEQSGVLTEKYFRGSTIDELVAGYVTQSGNLTPYLFQHDQTMNVSAETKPNGGTQASMAYYAFGETQATTGTPVNRLQYTGRENDGTGLYYYRARYYDPSIGRFISEDPKKFAAGINFFAYVNNNPVNANDPSGESAASDLLKVVIGAFKPGPFAKDGVLLTGPGRPSAATQNLVNQNGAINGCHLCGATEPGTVSGNWVVDHTPPSALVQDGTQQLGFPSCINCSRVQGGMVSNAVKTGAGVTALGVAGNADASTGILGSGITWTDVKNTFIDVVTDPSTYYAPLALLAPGNAGGAGDTMPQFSGGSGASAAGGFLLYPNKPNTNQLNAVYSK